jgi:hypothetical protein
MRRTAALVMLAGCGVPYQRVTTTQVRQQDALVMAPAPPLGFGARLPMGAGSGSLGAAFTASLPTDSDDVGSQILPLEGLARGALAATDGVELTVSGSVASPDVGLEHLTPVIEGRDGYLGRGDVGLRMFASPAASRTEWAFAVDFGAEATHDLVTDTVTTENHIRFHEPSQRVDSSSFDRLRTLPHARLATSIRAPVAPGVWAVTGAQVQTWPTYWATRTQVDTCTSYRGGYEDCDTEGSIDGAPSRAVAVFSPTVGVAIPVGGASVLVQTWANLGVEGVQTAPWGALVTVERAWADRED